MRGGSLTVCLVKKFTGYPCPSCGITRSILHLIHGDVLAAVFINPAGLIVAPLMVILPVWIFIDLVLGRQSLAELFPKIERHLTRKCVHLPLLVILTINWAWSIAKGI